MIYSLEVSELEWIWIFIRRQILENIRILNDRELENVTGGISESVCGFLVLVAMWARTALIEKLDRLEETQDRDFLEMQENIQNAIKKVISNLKI